MKPSPLRSGQARPNVTPEEKGKPYDSLLYETCRNCFAQLIGPCQITGLCTWCMFDQGSSRNITGIPRRRYGHTKER